MQSREQGVTLVELMIVIALLAIMAQIAVPAWQSFIAKTRSQALQHSVIRAVQSARAQAITTRNSIELCGSSNGEACSSNWSNGWMIRTLPRHGAPEAPSHITELDPRHLRLQWAGFRSQIVFHPTGLSSASNGRFFVCREQAIDWQLVLNRQGRLRRASTQENREHDYRCTQ